MGSRCQRRCVRLWCRCDAACCTTSPTGPCTSRVAHSSCSHDVPPAAMCRSHSAGRDAAERTHTRGWLHPDAARACAAAGMHSLSERAPRPVAMCAATALILPAPLRTQRAAAAALAAATSKCSAAEVAASSADSRTRSGGTPLMPWRILAGLLLLDQSKSMLLWQRMGQLLAAHSCWAGKAAPQPVADKSCTCMCCAAATAGAVPAPAGAAAGVSVGTAWAHA
eukprot:137417-Chlamydomonas_euryale.AAC.5